MSIYYLGVFAFLVIFSLIIHYNIYYFNELIVIF